MAIAQSTRSCSVSSCDRPMRARGWCPLHYVRWLRQGDPMKLGRPGRPPGRYRRRCQVTACSRLRYGRGLCAMHYRRWRRHGTPDVITKRPHGAGTLSVALGYRRIVIKTKGRNRVFLEHRLVMERILGHVLGAREHVHHIDGDRLNNDPANPMIISPEEHSRLHHQKTPTAAGSAAAASARSSPGATSRSSPSGPCCPSLDDPSPCGCVRCVASSVPSSSPLQRRSSALVRQ